ncbi:sigma-70 family RNA polymerase sigma factor [Thermopolyspora sp. NPDC052614]|uniref:RNA polymerase sigma factor n=1 Tax=Thermopolyspora sp. NPDC052614 TaxID=3155682 RepID=UPI003442713E
MRTSVVHNDSASGSVSHAPCDITRPQAGEARGEPARGEPGGAVSALVNAAARGDASAWEALVERFSPLVWSVIRAHRLADADVEDVWQITWFRLTSNLHKIKDPERVGAWLASTARHEALRLIRTSRRVTPVEDLDTVSPWVNHHSPESPEQAVLESEQAAAEAERLQRLGEAFELMPERCRRLLRLLMATPPPSYHEISEALGMPVGSIGPTRARCLDCLRKIMAGETPRTRHRAR